MKMAFRVEVQRILDEQDVWAVANYLGRFDIERLQGIRGPMVEVKEFRELAAA